MRLILERSYLPHCTIGELYVPGLPKYFTIEKPWRGNALNVSCIPEGMYTCLPFSGNRFKDVWQLKDVPSRTYILIHTGNTSDHVQGCIAIGKKLSTQSYTITHSRKAMDELREFLPKEFSLRITVKQPGFP